MTIIEIYNISKIQDTKFLTKKLEQAQEKLDQINDTLENWDLYLQDFAANELKEDIQSYENRIIEILTFLQNSNRITFSDKNPKEAPVKKEKNNFDGFVFVAEQKGIKVFRKGSSKSVYVSYRGEVPAKYPFAKISDFTL